MKTSLSFYLNRSWRLKFLIFWNFALFFLFMSLFLPPFSFLWEKIDISFFYFINQSLKKSELLRIFWAITNHSLADWLEDLCIFGFYVAAIWKTPKEMRLRKGSELFFCVLLIALTILFINRLVCRDLLQLRRQSPSLVLNQVTYLSDFLSWIEVKAYSSKSFPGDHATTAFMFAFSYAYLVRGRLAILALFYGAFLCLPRLAVGAHWLSDIIVGSGCIALFSLSWMFFTPLANRCINYLEKCLRLFAKMIKRRFSIS